MDLKKCVYIDAREMIKIIQDMWYVLTNNTKYNKNFRVKYWVQSEAETLTIKEEDAGTDSSGI
jgi:hypothetical protein